MKILVILALSVAAALAAPAEEISPNIVGGINALPGEFPFIVSLQWVVLGLSTHMCGGSIISPIWVLSVCCAIFVFSLYFNDIWLGGSLLDGSSHCRSSWDLSWQAQLGHFRRRASSRRNRSCTLRHSPRLDTRRRRRPWWSCSHPSRFSTRLLCQNSQYSHSSTRSDSEWTRNALGMGVGKLN